MALAAEAHVRIIHAMDRHEDDAQVQVMACGALWNLAVNDANQARQLKRTCASSTRWAGTKTTRNCRRRPAAR